MMGNSVNTTSGGDRPDTPSSRVIYDVLSDDRCRNVLAALTRFGPMREKDLAAAVWADEHDYPVEAVADVDAQSVRSELYHVALPRLVAAELVSHDGQLVESRLAEGTANRPELRAFVEADRTQTAQYLKLLCNEERRAALTVLSTAETRMELSTLAESIAASSDSHFDDHQIQSLRVSLHHLHLPKLDQAGLVDYDPDEHVVERTSYMAVVDDPL